MGRMKSALQGDPEAQRDLGVCFFYGEGVHKNPAEAVKWYRRAAKQCDAKAQYNLALCYEHGDGVRKNWRQALMLFSAASRNGHLASRARIRELKRTPKVRLSQAALR